MLSPAEAAIKVFKDSYRARLTPTPLSTFLHIYTHAETECYINYMEGAKALAKYLAPIEVTTGAWIDTSFKMPDLLASYDLYELAKILKPHLTTLLLPYQIENAIYEQLTQPR